MVELITISVRSLVLYVLLGVIVGYFFGAFMSKRDIITNWEWNEEDYEALARIIVDTTNEEKPKRKRKKKNIKQEE